MEQVAIAEACTKPRAGGQSGSLLGIVKGNDGVRIPKHIAAQHIAQVTGNDAQHTTSVQIRDGEGGIGELHVLQKR
jgi:hypothetical protein